MGGESSVQGVLVPAVSARETSRMVTCGWYASYWNAFLLSLHIAVADQSRDVTDPCRSQQKTSLMSNKMTTKFGCMLSPLHKSF